MESLYSHAYDVTIQKVCGRHGEAACLSFFVSRSGRSVPQDCNSRHFYTRIAEIPCLLAFKLKEIYCIRSVSCGSPGISSAKQASGIQAISILNWRPTAKGLLSHASLKCISRYLLPRKQWRPVHGGSRDLPRFNWVMSVIMKQGCTHYLGIYLGIISLSTLIRILGPALN